MSADLGGGPGRTTLSVVMAAYNEAATVGTVIEQVLAQSITGVDIELIVVESGSADGTREICRRYASDGRVKLIEQDRPRGKGNAVREGLQHASGDIVLIQDADLEYRIEDYPVVLEPILSGQGDFVLGCRHAPGKAMREFGDVRLVSRVMNAAHWVFTWLFNVVYGTRLRDPFTMYKVFRTKCIADVEFVADRFDFDWELVGKLVRLGFQPIEVPITYVSRGYDRGKKVRFVRDPLTWVVALVRFRVSPLRPPDQPLRRPRRPRERATSGVERKRSAR
ncbi:MAG: glycosyltransferase family 2 protein [Actinomycetota bacterium]